MTDHELIAKLTEALTEMFFAYSNKDADCPHQFEIEAVGKAEKALALARQHKTWRHLDRDEEKPIHKDWYLVSNGKDVDCLRYDADTDKFTLSAWRWWMPLPSPPKD